MRNQLLSYTLLAALACLLLPSIAPAQEESYAVPPEAEKQADVPEGKIEGPFTLTSQIYPGTERKFWLYVPAQYDPQKPACSMIVQDGLNRAKEWRLPQILDNLIHAKEVPPIIGILSIQESFLLPIPPTIKLNRASIAVLNTIALGIDTLDF